MMREIGVGIVGFGVMGRTHAEAYGAARRSGIPCRVRAVFSLPDTAGGATGNLAAMAEAADLEGARFTADVDALLADDGIDVVSICTPTDTHVALALRALDAGKHVLVEKPVALEAREIERLEAAAAGAARHCLPALCMRFWPAWVWLHERVQAGDLGAVRSAAFVRTGNPPGWGHDFYGDIARSGGALQDLHVHDVDFVHWCFGLPEAVSSAGGPLHLTTLYHFAGGPAPVSAEGGWLAPPGFPFRMRYSVEFDGGFAEFDLGAVPELRLVRGGTVRPIEVPAASAYHEEVCHFLGVVRGEEAPRVTLADAALAARIIGAEARSAAAGGARTPVRGRVG